MRPHPSWAFSLYLCYYPLRHRRHVRHTEYESGAQHSERADVVDPFIRINLVEGCTKFGAQ